MNNIPFLNFNPMHNPLSDELLSVFKDALATNHFIGGPMVENFEKEFAQFTNSCFCIGVGNGTDALRFLLMAGCIQKNDIIITVPNTFIATTEAISQAGAIIDFVDVDEKTYLMSPVSLLAYLETKCFFDAPKKVTIKKDTNAIVRAILPVHLYGQMADMDLLHEIAEKYNLLVFEDACQAHGSEYYSEKANGWINAGYGSQGAAYSFYPGKNLGAFGEAGAVTTNDQKIANTLKMIRDHGQSKKYYHEVEGYNGRLDAIQAGILSVKLKHLNYWNNQRQKAASVYNDLLKDCTGVITPFVPEWSKPVYHLYIIRVSKRDALQKHLAEKGISTGLHYPVPLHLQNAYTWMGYPKGSFPVSELSAGEILSLPMFPGVNHEEQRFIADAITGFYGKT